MTPPASAAARSAARTAPRSRRTPVRHPRRVSGPATPARAAVAVAISSPGVALPRHPSRPVAKPRRRSAAKVAPRLAQGGPGIALRAIDALEGISSSSVLDRLIRGRAWIGLLAFALIGIVAMQLLVLELNTGIGRTLTRVAQLQRENAQLGIEASAYSAESRIAPLATATGMTLAPVGTVHFVAASPSDLSRAATALSAPIQTVVAGQTASSEAGGGSGSSEAGGGSAAEASGGSGSSEAGGESASAETSGGSGSAEVGGGSGSSETSGTEASSETAGSPEPTGVSGGSGASEATSGSSGAGG
jgi:hypothetical protein